MASATKSLSLLIFCLFAIGFGMFCEGWTFVQSAYWLVVTVCPNDLCN